MELVMELLVSALIAIALSFLIAKLVSAILAPDGEVGRGSEAEIVMEELRLRSAESGGGVEAVHGEVEKVVRFGGEVPDNVGDLVESEVVGLSVSEKKDDDREIEVRDFSVSERDEIGSSPIGDGNGNEEIGVVECEEEVQKSEKLGFLRCEEEDQKNEEIGVLRCEEENQKSEEIGVLRCEEEEQKSDEIGIVRCEEEEEKSGAIDEEWEGIERSELDKVFASAAKFVNSGDHSEELSDVEMELYGLHKVATEGPCRDSQPMALRLSARANWNAWQRLGNMNPDVAMERYVSLLSHKIPGWTKDNCAGDTGREVFEEGTTSTQDPKSITFSPHERKPEMNSAAEDDHPTETSHVVEMVKE